MKFTIAVTAVIFCLTSCFHISEQGVYDNIKTFTATVESSTRTSLDENHGIIWNTQDSIDVFVSFSKKYCFKDVTVSQDGKEAHFSGSIPISDAYFALYPANPDSYFESECIYTTMPSEQVATISSFDPKANIAISKTTSENLYFRNIGSLIGFKINNDDIVSVTLSGSEVNNGDMTGDCGIEMIEGIPRATTLGGENHVTLLGDFEKGETYYAAIYPGSYENLEIIYVDNKGRTATFQNSTALTISRNELKDIVNITVKEEDWEEEVSTDWNLVTSESGLVIGNSYILACNATGDQHTTCVVASELSNEVFKTADATSYISSDKKKLTSTPDKALIFQLGGKSGAWTFENNDGKKLGSTKVKKLAWGAGDTLWKISFSSDNSSITNNTSSYGTFAYNTTNPRITTYGPSSSGMKSVQLYSRINASSVTTDMTASNITKESADLSGSYICVKSIPSEAGFLYGLTESELTATVYASAPVQKIGTFGASLVGLNSSTTYYFKAFVKEGGSFKYGKVSSFTTLSAGGGGGTGQADYSWPELPAQKDKNRDGIDDDNPDYYYSHTMRADASTIRNFSSCYSKSKIHPVWVAAPMHSCYKGSSGRNDSYKSDPNIKCTQSPKFDGYTRGHMVGSVDRTISVATNRQAFYYSNIGAQTSAGFNTGGGAWNNLENKVDSYLCADTLYQVIGCIFESFTDKYGKTINAKTGTNSVGTFHVPTAWYKVLLRTKSGNSGKRVADCTSSELQCVAFILGHYSNASHKPTTSDMYSVSELEALTGLTFFVNVPNAPKTTYSASDWGL